MGKQVGYIDEHLNVLTNNHEALQRAINIIGGQRATARLLDVSQGTVWYWLRCSRNGLPAGLCVAVEAATKGEVKQHELRSDVFRKPR